MRTTICLLAALFLLASTAAQAELRGVFALGAGLVTFDDGVDDVSPTNLYVRLAAASSRHFEAGAEVGFTVLADRLGGVDFDVDTRFFYLQGNLPVSETLLLFLRGGLAQTELTGEANGASASIDDDDTALGVGARFMTRETFFVVVDYTRYFDDDEFDGFAGDFVTDAINLGVGGYF